MPPLVLIELQFEPFDQFIAKPLVSFVPQVCHSNAGSTLAKF
jgi:hypothetical protein